MRPILWIISKKNVGLYGIPEFLTLLDLFLREHVPSAAWPHRGPPLPGRSRLHRPTLVPARAGSCPRDSYPPSEPPSARGSAMHPRLGHLLWPRAAPPAAAHGDSTRDLALGAGLCRRAAVRPPPPSARNVLRGVRLDKGAAGAGRKKEGRVVRSFSIALRRVLILFIFLVPLQVTELKVGVN